MNNERSAFETFLLALGIALVLAALLVVTYLAARWLWRRFHQRSNNEVKFK